MSAQINLYQEEFHIKTLFLDLKKMMLFAMIFIVGMGLFIGADIWQLNNLNDEIAGSEAAFSLAQDARESLQKQLASATLDPTLIERIEEFEIILANLGPLEQLLEQDSFAKELGYSNYLTALARQRLPGMWFNDIHIKGAGQDFTLAGQAITAQLLPQYLQELNKESLLTGTEFSTLTLKQADTPNPVSGQTLLIFTVTSGEDQEQDV